MTDRKDQNDTKPDTADSGAGFFCGATEFVLKVGFPDENGTRHDHYLIDVLPPFTIEGHTLTFTGGGEDTPTVDDHIAGLTSIVRGVAKDLRAKQITRAAAAYALTSVIGGLDNIVNARTAPPGSDERNNQW